MSGKAVAQRVQCRARLDPGGIGRLMEEPAQMTRRYRLAGSPALSSGKQPTFQYRRFPIVTRGPRLPPLPQQSEHLGREHNIAIFAALRLLDADDFLRAVDVFDLQPDPLAPSQTRAKSTA